MGQIVLLVAEHHDLQDYTPDGYSQAIMQVLETEKPEGFILGHTSIGKDHFTTNCCKVEIRFNFRCCQYRSEWG